MRIFLGVTGATGAALAVDFLKRCPAEEKYVAVSAWGRRMVKEETGLDESQLRQFATKGYSDGDLNAPFSSGATPFDAMAVLPCSADMTAKIACGLCDTLISRTAHVALKEGRKLVLCVRETPMDAILLENCLKLARLGATVAPIMPSFYRKPSSVEDIVRDFNDRLFALLGCGPSKPWREEAL